MHRENGRTEDIHKENGKNLFTVKMYVSDLSLKTHVDSAKKHFPYRSTHCQTYGALESHFPRLVTEKARVTPLLSTINSIQLSWESTHNGVMWEHTLHQLLIQYRG